MKKWQIVVLVIAVAVLAAGIGAYAATNYGTQSDPLVAMSYLEKVLGPKMEQQLDEQIAEAAEQYKSQYGAEAGGFSVVQLPSGGTLSVGEGCEIVLRSGACAPPERWWMLRAAPSWPLAARSLQITSTLAPAPA